ncbi:MAG: HDOD domain-containing protein [Hydrogenovibrio sp.]|uniref:HDOD domain-containing protein n=1 Tax=Hydrogenovibrio sp. TaxID=2065821 RepID=UPI0028705982|nr:HDOD domain-containing protein [Hydrogenovibrio sp.]MDR9497758.1 HDOD domain-containing protein [Hydrogenovibrio sp.]
MSQHRITSTEVIDRLDSLKNLPTFSGLLGEYDALMASPKGSHLKNVVTLLHADPRISTGLLKSANSARFNPGSKQVTDLGEAISLMGNNDVRMLIVTWNFYTMFRQTTELDQAAYLSHSMVAGFIGKRLAPLCKIDADQGFSMGLLHDLGVYLLALYAPETVAELRETTQGKAGRHESAEKKLFATTHAHVGARMVNRWQQPKSVVMGILGHQNPALVPREFQAAARLTALAQAGAFYLGYGNGLIEDAPDLLTDTTKGFLKRLGISEETFVDASHQALQEAKDTGLL